MAFLRQWLLGVVSCAFLVSLLDQLTPEGSVRKLARFSGGLVLILCMLRPLGTAEPWELALDLDGFSADRAALEEQYRDVSGQSLAAVIAERTGAYIEDKAHALGTEVTAEVTVREDVADPGMAFPLLDFFGQRQHFQPVGFHRCQYCSLKRRLRTDPLFPGQRAGGFGSLPAGFGNHQHRHHADDRLYRLYQTRYSV